MNKEWVLIDTNIVSYLMRGDTLGKAYAKLLHNKKCAVSFITIGELYLGAEKARRGEQKRHQIEIVIENLTVIFYVHNIAKLFAIVVAERENSGRPISYHDAWIAACALCYDIPLVTHNIKDFDGISELTVSTVKC